MRYRIHQTARYDYDHAVPYAHHLVRLVPRARGPQMVTASTLTIDPAPEEQQTSVDVFDNAVTHFAIRRPHRALVVDSWSEVTLAEVPPVDPEATPTVAAIRDAALADRGADGRSPAHHLFPSRLVPLEPAIRDYADASLAGDRPLLAGAVELMRRVHADFIYDPIATDVTTPVAVAFATRRGVCQDFAHIMIAGLRGLGLPAAYVSGYLRTEPAPGQMRLVGADAMHAWVAVWCGADAGWVGLDPTNATPTGFDHVEVAFGRDYADVSPLDGVIVSAGAHRLSVAVDVAPM